MMISNKPEWPSDVDQFITSVSIYVGRLPSPALRRGAKSFHEVIIDQLVAEGSLHRESLPQDRTFQQRLMVNYLRHNHVNAGGPRRLQYFRLVRDAQKIYDAQKVYWGLHNRLLDSITERFPMLENAASRQRGEYLIEPSDIFRPYMRELDQ